MGTFPPEMKVSGPGKSRLIPMALGMIWLCAATWGLGVLMHYEKSAGLAARPPIRWPADSRLPRDPDQPTLMMMVHPHCPCSRASLGELAKLMAVSQGKVKAFALFYKPATFAEGWEKTDLWRSAERIPGVQVICDTEGSEAERFNALTSGQTILYDRTGRLQFSGGITLGRGHSGDNAGRSTLFALLHTGRGDRPQTFVFGCSLGSPNSTNLAQTICCQK